MMSGSTKEKSKHKSLCDSVYVHNDKALDDYTFILQ